MFWTIDRFEGEFAVLMDDNGVCRNVPRGRLPEQVRQGDVLTEKAGGYQPDVRETVCGSPGRIRRFSFALRPAPTKTIYECRRRYST